MTALSSFSNSLSKFINSDYGLGEEVQYYHNGATLSHTTKKLEQFKSNNENSHRVIESEDILDKDIFLIELPFEPMKNDKIIIGTKEYFVDTFPKVATDIYRVKVTSNMQIIPRTNQRWELWEHTWIL